jgi:hypothetical protein
MRPSAPKASAASLPPPLLRLLPGGTNQFPGGTFTRCGPAPFHGAHIPNVPLLPQRVVSPGLHNKAALAVLAKLMREAVCRLFLSVYSNGCSVGGDLRERTGFLAPYGFQGDMVDFTKVSTSVTQRLLDGENLDPRYVRGVLSTDICDRVERLIADRKRRWPSMTDAQVNEGMKWSEFERKHPERIAAIWQPARELMYLMMDVIREVDRPVSSGRFSRCLRVRLAHTHRRAPPGAAWSFGINQVGLPRGTAVGFRRVRRKAQMGVIGKDQDTGFHQLRNAGDVGPCLDRYFNLDLELGEIERCYDDAASAIEAAAEFQYELEAGK